VILALLASALMAACGGGSDHHEPVNDPPAAVLMAPVEVGTGWQAWLDASASSDPDGLIVSYRFIFGDGGPSDTLGQPRVGHAYDEPGSYQAALTVTDDDGDSDEVMLRIRVVDGLERPACGPGLPCGPASACLCLADSDCTAGACQDRGCPDGAGICYQEAGREGP
jgi:hypothetical protein